jgi:hypothetical protein
VNRYDPNCVKNARELLRTNALCSEILACSSLVGFLPTVITKLESNQMPLNEAFSLLDDVQNKLETNTDSPIGQAMLAKFHYVLDKNSGTS